VVEQEFYYRSYSMNHANSKEVSKRGQSPWIEPTTAYWQAFEPPGAYKEAPWRFGYPARLPDGRVLRLPIRLVPGDGTQAVASLIANQASLEVIDGLAAFMAELAQPLKADVVIGLPTLGQVFAQGIAARLGHARTVPLGYSRKFWYEERLSVELRSITTPDGGKRAFLDPNQLPLVQGRRVVVVDDAASTGSTLAGVLPFLESLGAEVAGVVVAMLQGERWRETLGARAGLVQGVYTCPRLALRDDGWYPE
jgi:adenine/guanine phosphoribosyltransferase-like PRPP-binding protein